MKVLVQSLTLFSLLFSPALGLAQEDEPVYYTDEDEEFFNRGKFVGTENNEYLKAVRRTRNRNWGIALGAIAAGVTAIFFVKDRPPNDNPKKLIDPSSK